MSGERKARVQAESDLIARVRAAARQEQFLEVVSAEEARSRFERHLDLTPLPGETVALAAALNRVLAGDVVAAVDAPPFDRSNVDGFALRAADTMGASDIAPKRLTLNAEVVACGYAPKIEVAPGTATAIATGGVAAARRRRGGDDRAHRAAERGHAGHRIAPRCWARPVRLLRRLRHRPRRDIAATGNVHWFARDRHARRLRAGESRRGAAAEGGGAVDRRRTGGAGRAAQTGRRL